MRWELTLNPPFRREGNLGKELDGEGEQGRILD
jgi:hypothetical protein